MFAPCQDLILSVGFGQRPIAASMTYSDALHIEQALSLKHLSYVFKGLFDIAFWEAYLT